MKGNDLIKYYGYLDKWCDCGAASGNCSKLPAGVCWNVYVNSDVSRVCIVYGVGVGREVTSVYVCALADLCVTECFIVLFMC